MIEPRPKSPPNKRSKASSTKKPAPAKAALDAKAEPAVEPPARGKAPPFEVRRSAIQGRGVFATRTIRKGTRVIEYVGERISQREANRRYVDEDMKRHHTFLFSVDARTCIDAAHQGNDARFINHSCDPNCEALLEDGRIFIYATKTLSAGDELSYDYQYIVDPPIDEATRRMYVCRCGAATCRGSILKETAKAAPAKKKAPAKKRESSSRSRA